jgi:hypothetical protein
VFCLTALVEEHDLVPSARVMKAITLARLVASARRSSSLRCSRSVGRRCEQNEGGLVYGPTNGYHPAPRVRGSAGSVSSTKWWVINSTNPSRANDRLGGDGCIRLAIMSTLLEKHSTIAFVVSASLSTSACGDEYDEFEDDELRPQVCPAQFARSRSSRPNWASPPRTARAR